MVNLDYYMVNLDYHNLDNCSSKGVTRRMRMFQRMCVLCFFSFVFIVGTWDVLKGNLVTVASILREKRSVNYLKWFLVFYTLHYLHTSSIIKWKHLGTRLEYDIGEPMGEKIHPNFRIRENMFTNITTNYEWENPYYDQRKNCTQ